MKTLKQLAMKRVVPPASPFRLDNSTFDSADKRTNKMGYQLFRKSGKGHACLTSISSAFSGSNLLQAWIWMAVYKVF